MKATEKGFAARQTAIRMGLLTVFAFCLIAGEGLAGEPERIFSPGNTWLENRTGDQLAGFTTIMLSSYMDPDYS